MTPIVTITCTQLALILLRCELRLEVLGVGALSLRLGRVRSLLRKHLTAVI